jgi:deoxyribodipyrimidine photolyase-like uncharacterized protein
VKKKYGVENWKSHDEENRGNDFKKLEKLLEKKMLEEKMLEEKMLEGTEKKQQNFGLPVTHAECEQHFLHFLNNKLAHFGEFQDIIREKDDDKFLFHSGISMFLN